MNETQARIFELLVELDEICEKHNLKYYLAGGCAIGAYRHKGFLPWDDDADVLMPLDDARELRKLELANEFPPHRKLIWITDYDAGLLCRYVDTTTTALQRATYPSNSVPHGLFVDIFLLCPAPDDEEEQKRFVCEYQVAKNICSNWLFAQGMTREERVLLKRRWNPITRLLGRKAVGQYYENELFSERWANSRTYFVRSPTLPQFLDKDLLESGTERIPFEGILLNVYTRSREGLSQTFGSNWVEIPQATSIRSVGHVMVTDSVFPFSRIRNDIAKVDNLPLARFLNRGVKAVDYKNIVDRYDTEIGTSRFEAQVRAYQFNSRWQESGIDLDYMEQSQDFANSDELFAQYHKMLKSPRFSFAKLGIPICDDALWAAWYPQFQRGNYLGALKAIRRVRPEGTEDDLTPRLKKLLDDCTDADQYMHSVWTLEDYDLARAVLAKHRDDAHPSVVFVRGFLAIDCLDAKSTSDYGAVHDAAMNALSAYPGDGEMSYWDGLALKSLGRRDKAIKQLQIAADHSLNGLIRLLAKDILEEEFGLA